MDNRPLGIFDSGLGGLTTVKEIISALPSQSIIYFGDTGRVPYGTRSRSTIIKYVTQDINFLMGFDIKMIIAACGTASAVALPEITHKFDLPIIGVVEPAAAAACRITQNKRVGIIGTAGTINSGAYEKKILSIDPSIKTFSAACPLFVPMVESGYINNRVTHMVAEDYLGGLREQGVDTLIMGCTHYPLLSATISDIMGQNVKLISPGAEASKIISGMTDAHSDGTPCRKYFVSDREDNFNEMGSLFLGENISAQEVDIETY